MKIGIDARMLSSHFGIGRYVQQLVEHLLDTDKENQYVLFTQKIPWYGWEEQVKFKRIIDKEKVDLMHFPHWNVPLFYNKPFVVTIHDLTMYHYPRPEATTLGPLKFWLKDKAHRLVVRHAVKRAKKIIVTSEFTKQDVHQTLGVPMEKMVVTYQAPFKSDEFTANSSQPIVNDKYILYVGAAYPHKNLEGLLKAWKIFEDKYGGGYKLVLVGKDSYFYNNLQSEICPDDNTGSRTLRRDNLKSVIHLNNVSDEELSALYQDAKLFVFPSLYEGFGLPPLEAMSHGVPVASSNRSCMPEVLGEAALYFDPENYEQMADVIYHGLTNDEVRFVLKNNISDLLKTYSWDKLARETLGVYKEVIGDGR